MEYHYLKVFIAVKLFLILKDAEDYAKFKFKLDQKKSKILFFQGFFIKNKNLKLLVLLPSSMKVMDRLNAQLDVHCQCLVTGQQVQCLMVCLSVKLQVAIEATVTLLSLLTPALKNQTLFFKSSKKALKGCCEVPKQVGVFSE